jgi:hypothetical protein
VSGKLHVGSPADLSSPLTFAAFKKKEEEEEDIIHIPLLKFAEFLLLVHLDNLRDQLTEVS